MANVQIIKLASGEDIMGEVSDTEIDGKAFLLVERPAVCDGGKTDDELVLTPKNLKQHPLIILRGHAERVSIFITRLIRRKQW